MTAPVYQTRSEVNDKIVNCVDALYFTRNHAFDHRVWGHHPGRQRGKAAAGRDHDFGISRFLRPVQVMLRPPKAHFPCPTCGLRRHDHDAVRCKACGAVLNIPDDGVN